MVTEVDKGVNVSPVPEVVTVHLAMNIHIIIIIININIIYMYVGSWYLAPFLTLIPSNTGSIPPNAPNIYLIYPQYP